MNQQCRLQLPAPSSNQHLLCTSPGAISGRSTVRLPMYLASISRLSSKPPQASMTLPPSTSFNSPSGFLTLTQRIRHCSSMRSLTACLPHHGTVPYTGNLGEEGYAGLYET